MHLGAFCLCCLHSAILHRASVKLFELGVRTPVGLFLGIWYAGGIDLLCFHTSTSLSRTEDQRNAEAHQ